jgi:hypothetical protein
MKKIYKKLKLVRKQIADKKAELKNIGEIIYYETIGKGEKVRDEFQVRNEISDLLKIEFTLLENLQRQCEFAKANNSTESRSLILKIHGV